MIKHASPISGIDTWENQWVATAGYDNQVILWDMQTRKSLYRGYHEHLVNKVRFSSCGQYLLSCGSDHLARLWKVPEMRLVTIYCHHLDDVEMAVMDQQSRYVATACRDHQVRLFSIDGSLLHTFEGHTSDVTCVEFNMELRQLHSSGDDGTVRVWDIDTGRLLRTFTFDGVETDTICMLGDTVFAGNDDGKVIVIKHGKVIHAVAAHQAGIKSMVCSSKAGIIISSSYDCNIKVWHWLNTRELKEVEVVKCPNEVWLRSIAIVNEQRIVFGTFGSTWCEYNRQTRAWNFSNWEPTHGLNAVSTFRGRRYMVGDSGSVLVEGKELAQMGSLCNFLLETTDLLITGGQSGELFNALTGEVLYRHRSPLNCGVKFCRDGKTQIIIGTYTGEGLLFRYESDRLLFVKEVQIHDNAIKGLAVNDKVLFSVCATGAGAFHRLQDFTLLRQIPKAHGLIANGAATLHDGRFASVSRDRTLRVWGAGFNASVIQTPHTHSIKCVASALNTPILATGAYDGRIALYNTNSGEWKMVLRPTTSGISCLCFDSGVRKFLASSYDGHVYEINYKEILSEIRERLRLA